MKGKYYSLIQANKVADIYIYGDITSWPWYEDDVSSFTLSKELQELGEVDEMNIYINSYGGEVAEGLAIYNALKRHPAKIKTYVDGFACSIASVIFAAGDERYMSNTSLLMIHNAWTRTSGNANELRKEADDLEKITQSSVNAYMDIVNISQEELQLMLDSETWLEANESIEKGFATELIDYEGEEKATQSVRQSLHDKVLKQRKPLMSVTLDEEKLREIMAEQFAKLEEKYFKPVYEEQNNKSENKPRQLMKAFFNTKEED